MRQEIKDRIEKIRDGEVPEGYKRNQLGVIPKEWGVDKFKSITDVLRCGIASTPQYVDVGVPFLSSQNVKENKITLDKYNHISEDYHKKLTKNNQVEKGDILYTRVGANFGLAAVVDIDMEFSIYVSLTHIRMKREYDNLFYSYMLNTEHYRSLARRSVFQGGGVPNLNVKVVEKFDMATTTKEEQKKIATILSIWDKAIELKKQLLEQKNEQKRGLLKKLLYGEVRLPAFMEDWKEVKLSEVARQSTLKNDKNQNFRVLSCTKYDGLVDSLEYFGRKMYSDDISKYKVVKRGQICYATNHIEEGSIGILDKFDFGLVSPMYTVFEVNNDCDSNYIFQVLKSERYVELYKSLMSASVNRRGSLRWNEFSKIKIMCPPNEEQEAIARFIDLVNHYIDLLEQELEALKLQKKGLMQLLLTGIVRVPN